MGSNTPALRRKSHGRVMPLPRPGPGHRAAFRPLLGTKTSARSPRPVGWIQRGTACCSCHRHPIHPSILNRTAEVGIGSCPLLSKVSGLCCASPFLRPPFPAPARAPIRASLSCSLAYRPNCFSSTPARLGSVLAAPFSSRCGPTDWEPRSRLFLAPLPSGCSMESSPAPWPVAAG